MASEPRALDPQRPWPTADQATARVVRWAVYIVASQFYLNALAPHLPENVMTALWAVAGTSAAVATFRFENFMSKRRRYLP